MKALQLSIVFIALLFSVAAANFNNDCVYTLYVKTNWMIKAGTDSKISVVLGDSYGRSVWIQDLRSQGLMPPDHDYFERGNLDAFSVRGGCIDLPCSLNLTSDGLGRHHGWYCDYVEVTSTGPQTACTQAVFFIDQWLASDAPPFQLTAYRDGCYRQDEHLKRGKQGPFVVGNPIVET
ncbi:PLAT domain protein 2 [Hibiscus trionum]|uniref:PLAT domain protein 2 n=1 Tax=Hibiscus trionum TaxID=183268 RepID=A0A9W7J0L2_HIBTR|nr:PLAT domain protein 2 [Hibiscus trionum]